MRLSTEHQAWRATSPGGVAFDKVGLSFTARGRVEVVRLGQGEPIVIVPGLAGGWRLVAPLARRLARTNQVILYGLAGDEGPRGMRPHTSLGDYALDLAELIVALGLERPSVLGVSFGGAVALQLAVERPGLLGGLILTGAASSFPFGIGARVALHALESYPLPTGNPFINQFFNLLHAGKPGPEDLPEFVVERLWETDQGVMASRLRALVGFDVTDRLWQIDCPALIAAGTRDAIVPASRQRELARSIPGARFEVLQGAGHVGFLTHRVALSQHVGSMLRQRQGAAY